MRVPSDAMERPWRVGGHWAVTIIAEGHGEPDEDGRRPGDVLIGMALSPEAAWRVVNDHNVVLALAGVDP